MVETGETLTEAAYRAIRRDIIRGVRAPGERLRIERLRQLYDIGPTPLREALQKLSTEQLVLSEGNRGFAVAPLDFREFMDLNIARTDVELAALRRFHRAGGFILGGARGRCHLHSWPRRMLRWQRQAVWCATPGKMQTQHSTRHSSRPAARTGFYA